MRKAHGNAFVVLEQMRYALESDPGKWLDGQERKEERKPEPSGNIDASSFEPFQERETKSSDAEHRKRGLFFGITFGRD